MTSGTRLAEVVVVGGGVIGLATAYALARDGVKVWSVFPRLGDVTSASRAAGAMLGAFGEITADHGPAEQIELAFRLTSQRGYGKWLDELEERAGVHVFRARGTVMVGNNQGPCDRESLKVVKAEADRYGEPAEWIDLAEVPGLKPSPAQAPHGCLLLANEHSVDSAQLLDTLQKALETFATWGWIDGSVRAVEPSQQGAGWKVILAGGSALSAPCVVLAAGSRCYDALDPALRIEAGLPDLHFGKGVSCIVSGVPPIPQTIRTPNRAFACGSHVVPRADGQLYVGATNCLGSDHEIEGAAQPGELHNLFDEIIHQINTDLRCARIGSIRVGFRPIASTRRPLIGETRAPGLLIATGTYRNGVLMAPSVSSIIASTVRGTASVLANPYPVVEAALGASSTLSQVAAIGIRDIISFLQEPRAALPYNRAAELEKYVRVLFEMAVSDDAYHAQLRETVRERLRESPLNETMHKLFYDIVALPERGAQQRASSAGLAQVL